MAYTFEIASGATTYRFQVQPEFGRSFDYEYNDARTPPILTAELETWVLKSALFMGADGDVTADFESLRQLLGSRLVPVNAVRFLRDGKTVFEMNPVSHQGGVLVKGLGSTGGAGQWATHWRADITVLGRQLLADAEGIVRLEKELSYTYDASGLATVRLTGTLSTLPGISAEKKARALALKTPGLAYGLVTQGPGGDPNVTVLDPDTDTRARWESIWREHGIALPAGVNELAFTVETTDLPGEGERVVTTIRAKGPSSGPLKSAVRAKRPSTALADAREHEDRAGLEWSATYTQERPSATTQARTGSSKIVSRRTEYRIDGLTPESDDERDDEVYLIPGYEPYFVPKPRSPITLTERIVVRLRGTLASLGDFNLASRAQTAIADLRRQPSRCQPPAITLERPGITSDADLWRGEAVYVFLATEIDPDDVFELAQDQ